jgi:hypothetical protein
VAEVLYICCITHDHPLQQPCSRAETGWRLASFLCHITNCIHRPCSHNSMADGACTSARSMSAPCCRAPASCMTSVQQLERSPMQLAQVQSTHCYVTGSAACCRVLEHNLLDGVATQLIQTCISDLTAPLFAASRVLEDKLLDGSATTVSHVIPNLSAPLFRQPQGAGAQPAGRRGGGQGGARRCTGGGTVRCAGGAAGRPAPAGRRPVSGIQCCVSYCLVVLM